MLVMGAKVILLRLHQVEASILLLECSHTTFVGAHREGGGRERNLHCGVLV